jgi:hypothetical protein
MNTPFDYAAIILTWKYGVYWRLWYNRAVYHDGWKFALEVT